MPNSALAGEKAIIKITAVQHGFAVTESLLKLGVVQMQICLLKVPRQYDKVPTGTLPVC